MNSEFTIAVHCLVFLSMKAECMANSEDLSQSVGTHPARVRKVLSVLRKHGYLTTKEGAHGGISLAGPARRSSLASCTGWLRAVRSVQAGARESWIRHVSYPPICGKSWVPSMMAGRMR